VQAQFTTDFTDHTDERYIGNLVPIREIRGLLVNALAGKSILRYVRRSQKLPWRLPNVANNVAVAVAGGLDEDS
jgi:hypothetical protein